MLNNIDLPTFQTLILALQNPFNERQKSDLQQFVTDFQMKVPGTALLRFTPSSGLSPSDDLGRFCAEKQLRPQEAMLISDLDPILKAAAALGIACAGFQPAGAPDLSAAYLFEDFSTDLTRYLHLAYCRFHHRPMTIARTPQLLIRESCLSDLPGLLKLYVEDFSYGNTHTHHFFPPGDQEEFLKTYIRTMYDFYGIGMYTVVHRESGAIIGHCGFHFLPENLGDLSDAFKDGILSLGYLIAPAFRRQGYALEACRACLAFLSDHTTFFLTICRIHRDNKPSIALARKLGFQPLSHHDPVLDTLLRKASNGSDHTKKAEDADLIAFCLNTL